LKGFGCKRVKAFSASLKRIAAETIITGLMPQPKEVIPMQPVISDEKTKELLTEILVEMMEKKREVFQEVFVEALEEVGLANAVKEGRKNEFAGEDEIMSILEGKKLRSDTKQVSLKT
jgi:restriction endonuclease Mrr